MVDYSCVCVCVCEIGTQGEQCGPAGVQTVLTHSSSWKSSRCLFAETVSERSSYSRWWWLTDHICFQSQQQQRCRFQAWNLPNISLKMTICFCVGAMCTRVLSPPRCTFHCFQTRPCLTLKKKKKKSLFQNRLWWFGFVDWVCVTLIKTFHLCFKCPFLSFSLFCAVWNRPAPWTLTCYKWC